MTLAVISSDRVGSAPIQGELWSGRARDYADVQEPTFLPLYRSVLSRPELRDAGTLLITVPSHAFDGVPRNSR